MRTTKVAKWLLHNVKDVKVMFAHDGNQRAQQLLVAAGDWRKSINKQGGTLDKLETCIRNWESYMETSLGQASLRAALSHEKRNGHARPAPQRQAVNPARPTAKGDRQRNGKLFNRGRS